MNFKTAFSKAARTLCIFCLLFAFLMPQNVVLAAEEYLIPGGELFGVELDINGVLVTDFAPFSAEQGEVSPAKNAGLAPGDLICAVEGANVSDLAELTSVVHTSQGKPLKVVFLRGAERHEVQITPQKSQQTGKFQLGILVKEKVAGVGTVTFYDPQDFSFGGLGHGVCDATTESLLPLEGGTAYDVTLSKVVRGESGAPGELSASFEQTARGQVSKNTDQGVFGTLQQRVSRTPLPVAVSAELKEGDAKILCTVSGSVPQYYDVKISDVKRDGAKTKNFIVTVVDEALIAKTGGIVQGMSGSPIIQNGKLVGAVTHVLVRNPTRGYGIFIENMLSAAA